MCFTKADVLLILADIELGIVDTEEAMGVGLTAQDKEQGDLIREGKLRAYRYAKKRILDMAQWKGIQWN